MASRVMLRDREPFARWLREQFEIYRLSQSEFERQIGASQGQVSHWVRGKRTPSARWIKRFADYFGVDMDYLLTLAGYREPTPGIPDEGDPCSDLITKLRQIDLNSERFIYIDALLETMRKHHPKGATNRTTASARGRLPTSGAHPWSSD